MKNTKKTRTFCQVLTYPEAEYALGRGVTVAIVPGEEAWCHVLCRDASVAEELVDQFGWDIVNTTQEGSRILFVHAKDFPTWEILLEASFSEVELKDLEHAEALEIYEQPLLNRSFR